MAWEWLGPVTTAVVGVAGVAGTVWTASSGRRHQIDLTKAQGAISLAVSLAAEKRLVYAKFLQRAHVAFEEARILVGAGDAMALEDSSMPTPPPGVTYTARYRSGTPFALAMTELSKSHREVVISGGLRIGSQATTVMCAIGGYATGLEDVWAVNRIIAETGRLMHEDAMRPAGLELSSESA
ncbi:hypothetical protein [Salinispora vitiensis]|uniref:hypothetical protein n=1 Tax=Salinispora vitiensis TaxID=999544 RepID=UPI000534E42F|nr:hypothetical protein [Salinispora vitiensis]